MSLFSYNNYSKPSPSGIKFDLGGSKTSSQTPKDSTSGSSSRVNQFDYVPKRFGLRYNPPTIILEYLQPSSGKLYHHKMKMLNLKATSKNEDIIESLKKKHALYFSSNKIADDQIINLLEKIKKKLPKSDANNNGDDAGSGNIFKSSQPSTSENNSTKTGTSIFSSNPLGKLAPLAPNKTSAPFGKKANQFWDDDEDTKTKPVVKPLTSNIKEAQGGSNGFWSDAEDDDDLEVDYDTANLNKLSNEQLQKHKQKMDIEFAKNQKKPGDPGFVYDVQEEFNPQEENEWDEDF